VETWRERMIAMQDMVHNLPTKHFDTLKFLCEHLQRVSSFSAHNKMTQKNLSIIFGPTLLK
ncbi:Rho GTPase-activating protein domain-containing protein, partial [Chytridium lagenaria]